MPGRKAGGGVHRGVSWNTKKKPPWFGRLSFWPMVSRETQKREVQFSERLMFLGYQSIRPQAAGFLPRERAATVITGVRLCRDVAVRLPRLRLQANAGDGMESWLPASRLTLDRPTMN